MRACVGEGRAAVPRMSCTPTRHKDMQLAAVLRVPSLKPRPSRWSVWMDGSDFEEPQEHPTLTPLPLLPHAHAWAAPADASSPSCTSPTSTPLLLCKRLHHVPATHTYPRDIPATCHLQRPFCMHLPPTLAPPDPCPPRALGESSKWAVGAGRAGRGGSVTARRKPCV